LVKAEYVPDVGHVIWIVLNPQSGREQAGRRPLLVLSPALYNKKTSLVVGCPITSKVKGYPFEVALDSTSASGVVLVDQVKSLDWRARSAEQKGEASLATLRAVRQLLGAFLRLA